MNRNFKQHRKAIGLAFLFMGFVSYAAQAQYLLHSDSAFQKEAPMSGHLWGYVFGDYYYKSHSDALKRGTANQFAGINKGDNAFDIRRAYLGYDFNISPKFSTQFLLTAENWEAGEKIAPTLKYANFQWHGLWKRTDLIVGLSATPGFSQFSEKVWRYRSIERTIADMRGTQSYDLGIKLEGSFDVKENFGYQLMIGNGSGAKADKDNFRKFYGSIFGKFLNQKLTIQLYADYERLHWLPGFHHARNMTKLFIGYTGNQGNIGVEGFINYGQNDIIAGSGLQTDTVNSNATGLSLFVNGKIIDKKLGFFARIDWFNPYTSFQDGKIYKGLSLHYEPNTKEQFITAGLDFTPIKNIHIMPNVWYNAYRSQDKHLAGVAKYDYDLAYRLTFYFVFGKD